MIRRWWPRLLVLLVVAVAVHLAVIVALPRVAMTVAGNRIEDRAGDDAWLHAPRVTPQTQEVVRSSPDLAYSACAWDLSDGPLRLSAPGWEDYFSLSLYDSRSNNFHVVNGRDTGGKEVALVLATREQAEDLPAAEGVPTLVAPSETGIALLRYLAPTPETFERADQVRRAAVCEPR